MDNHQIFHLNVAVGTFVFIALQLWLASNYQIFDSRIITAIFIQIATFTIMIIAFHSSMLLQDLKKISISNNETLRTQSPTTKDILLILIAVVFGGAFAFIYTVSELNTDYLLRAAGIAAMLAILFSHIKFSYNVSKKP
jgi:hypothetical protein